MRTVTHLRPSLWTPREDIVPVEALMYCAVPSVQQIHPSPSAKPSTNRKPIGYVFSLFQVLSAFVINSCLTAVSFIYITSKCPQQTIAWIIENLVGTFTFEENRRLIIQVKKFFFTLNCYDQHLTPLQTASPLARHSQFKQRVNMLK